MPPAAAPGAAGGEAGTVDGEAEADGEAAAVARVFPWPGPREDPGVGAAAGCFESLASARLTAPTVSC